MVTKMTSGDRNDEKDDNDDGDNDNAMTTMTMAKTSHFRWGNWRKTSRENKWRFPEVGSNSGEL